MRISCFLTCVLKLTFVNESTERNRWCAHKFPPLIMGKRVYPRGVFDEEHPLRHHPFSVCLTSEHTPETSEAN